ncbi:MAG: TraB/GumN family protein [Chitinophagaceae bacterium]|nr:MAG: TraB/GumN family protein [Chitinophagaceae bacterium]
MKRISAFLFGTMIAITAFTQKNASENTLLWKISGNGLKKPSYLFGTIHMLCKDDAILSDSLKKVIRNVSEVYFEVDLDNMFEMLGVMSKMKMKGDTTLKDLLSAAEYDKVKAYFESKGSMLPFTMLESYKPMLAASTLQQGGLPCENTAMMEQEIMQEAKQHNKPIKGLESMGYQASVLDSIPYKLQAQQLVSYIDNALKGDDEDKEFSEMMNAYRTQDLAMLEAMLLKSDPSISNYTDILLYNRNRNWVEKLNTLLREKSLLIAVGAGHLPGKEGCINLLRVAGYKVTPIPNKITKKPGVEI